MELPFSVDNMMAIELLEMLGLESPTQKQIELIEMVTSNLVLNQQILFDSRLTKKERICLFFVAKGKNLEETAEILNIKVPSVAAYRRRIKRKLNAANMAHAVFEGIRFGYIQNVNCNN